MYDTVDIWVHEHTLSSPGSTAHPSTPVPSVFLDTHCQLANATHFCSRQHQSPACSNYTPWRRSSYDRFRPAGASRGLYCSIDAGPSRRKFDKPRSNIAKISFPETPSCSHIMSHSSTIPIDDLSNLMANVGLEEGYGTIPQSPTEPGYSSINTPTRGYGTQMSMSGSISSAVPRPPPPIPPQQLVGMHYATPALGPMPPIQSIPQDDGFMYFAGPALAPPFSPSAPSNMNNLPMPPGSMTGYPYGGPPPDMPPMSASLSDAGFGQLGQPFSPTLPMDRSPGQHHDLPPHPQYGLYQPGDRTPQLNPGPGSWRSAGNSNFQGMMSPQEGAGFYEGQPAYWTPPYSEGRKKNQVSALFHVTQHLALLNLYCRLFALCVGVGTDRIQDNEYNQMPRLSLNHSLSGTPRYTPPHQQTEFNRSPVRYGFGSNSGNFSESRSLDPFLCVLFRAPSTNRRPTDAIFFYWGR